jgi:hypothetical protein
MARKGCLFIERKLPVNEGLRDWESGRTGKKEGVSKVYFNPQTPNGGFISHCISISPHFAIA